MSTKLDLDYYGNPVTKGGSFTPTSHDLDAKIRTFMHYTESPSRNMSGITVFGAASEVLHYNYDDRFEYQKWHAALKEAANKGLNRETARFWQEALSVYHERPVKLGHIVLGCNRSNGFSWLCFGYRIGE